jgi:hypothetical protein
MMMMMIIIMMSQPVLILQQLKRLWVVWSADARFWLRGVQGWLAIPSAHLACLLALTVSFGLFLDAGAPAVASLWHVGWARFFLCSLWLQKAAA